MSNIQKLIEGGALVGQRVKGAQGLDRVRAGLKGLIDAGLLTDPRDRKQISQVMRALPGPFGRGETASDSEIVGFFDWMANENWDPVGFGSDTRFAGRGVVDDPRNDWNAGRERCDLYSIIATDVVAGNTGANSTASIAALDTVYRNAVLWLHTDGGRVRNITSLQVDGRSFYLGPATSMPCDLADITLEPHPQRQGIYLGTVNRSLSVTAFIPTSSTTVHWEVLLDAETDTLDQHRPGARVLHRGRYASGGLSSLLAGV